MQHIREQPCGQAEAPGKVRGGGVRQHSCSSPLGLNVPWWYQNNPFLFITHTGGPEEH